MDLKNLYFQSQRRSSVTGRNFKTTSGRLRPTRLNVRKTYINRRHYCHNRSTHTYGTNNAVTSTKQSQNSPSKLHMYTIYRERVLKYRRRRVSILTVSGVRRDSGFFRRVLKANLKGIQPHSTAGRIGEKIRPKRKKEYVYIYKP